MKTRLFAALILLTTLTATPVAAATQPKPDKPIYIASLPRSCDFYLTLNLLFYYQLNTFLVSNLKFPSDVIWEPALIRFAANVNLTNSDHIPATAVNTNMLTRDLGKMILLVRDPRDGLISWLEYTEQQRNHPLTLGLVYPPPPAGYYDWTYQQKADWQIAHYYTYAMTWLDQWAAFLSANPHLQVLVTHFEKFALQPLDAFREILTFYGSDPSQMTDANIMPMTFLQFRATPSEIGEWRNNLTPAQQQKVNSMLNPKTAKFFGWSN